MELNPFNFERTNASGIKKLSLRDTLEMVLGYRPCTLSKRLLPAMGMANARIYFSGTRSTTIIPVWDGDLDFAKFYKTLASIAERYGVILHVFGETCQKPVWTSAKPNAWLGWVSEEWELPIPTDKFPDVEIDHVYPHYKKIAVETQQQWLEDHGLAKKRRKKMSDTKKEEPKKKILTKVPNKNVAKLSPIRGSGIKRVPQKGREGSTRRR